MSAVVLFVSRGGSDELRFILQRRDTAEPMVMEARTTLDEEQRRNIARTLEPFAECVRGFPQDEARFRNVGEVLYSIALPQLIRKQLSEIEVPITILTDDPTIPWEIIHDGSDFLSLRLPVARQLIFEAQLAGYLRPLEVKPREFSALVIADPTEDLPGSRLEGEALHALFAARGHSEILLGRHATWSNIQGMLVQQPYSVIHICGHVDYDHNRHQHSIRLRDGWLSSDDVLPTFKGRPLVFLNACYSDLQVKTETIGRRTESLARAFMLGNENGAASAVVGTMWRVPDEPLECAMEFSLVFYRHLIDGGTLGEAMRLSREAARNQNRGPMVWSPYVIYADPAQAPFSQDDSEPSVDNDAPFNNGDEASDQDLPSCNEVGSTSVPGAEDRKNTGTSNPLDTTGRKVLRIALGEMSALDQDLLSSMHLLIGMCLAPVEELTNTLKASRIDPKEICEDARRQAKQMIPNKGQFGISASAAQLLVTAARFANHRDHDRVSGMDLLRAMLAVKDSQAVQILTRFGIQSETFTKAADSDVCPVQPEWFDDTTLKAVIYADRLSRESGIDFVPTPHLLVGLIRANADKTIALLREWEADLNKLCTQLTLIDKPATNPADITESPLPTTHRLNRIIKRAHRLARNGTDAKISEKSLLQAILEEDGFTSKQLALMGIDPKALLETLRHDRK
jgi:CHAT domain-containing protein